MKRVPRGTVSLALVTVLMAAACGSGSDAETADGAETNGDSATSAAPTTLPSAGDPTESKPPSGDGQPVTDTPSQLTNPRVDESYEGNEYPDSLAAMVGVAVTDLALRLTVDPEMVSVRLVEEVVWPNAGMGCPHPDMRYAQVMVDGLRIVLVHDGVEYRYHSGGSVEPFLCLPATTKDTRSLIAVPNDAVDRSDDTIDSVLNPVNPEAPKDSTPTEQAGGPGGPPND